jgi:hypothetical protein
MLVRSLVHRESLSAPLTHVRGHATDIHIGREAGSRKGFVNAPNTGAPTGGTVAVFAAERRSLRQTALSLLAEGSVVKQSRRVSAAFGRRVLQHQTAERGLGSR